MEHTHEEEIAQVNHVLDDAIANPAGVNAVGAAAMLRDHLAEEEPCETVQSAVEDALTKALNPNSQSNARGVRILVNQNLGKLTH